MALTIVESCVNCWACYDVCPSEAIYQSWPHLRIEARRCSECAGVHADPQCASICPVEGAIIDASGQPLNPPGSLTGIPCERLEDVRREIQAR